MSQPDLYPPPFLSVLCADMGGGSAPTADAPPSLLRTTSLSSSTVLSTIRAFPKSPDSPVLDIPSLPQPPSLDDAFLDADLLYDHVTSSLHPTTLPKVTPCLTEALGGDAKQAALFARRFASVHALLEADVKERGLRQDGSLNPSAAYLICLTCRVAEMLLDPPDPDNASRVALRVRAACDFFYSHYCVLHHSLSNPSSTPRSFRELIDASEPRDLSPSLRTMAVSGLSNSLCGPIKVNVLRVHLPSSHLRCVDARPTSLSEHIASPTCAAAISGGFFLYSESPILPPSARTDPVGLLVSDGEIVNPPSFARASLVEGVDGSVTIAPVSMCGWRVTFADDITERTFCVTHHNGLLFDPELEAHPAPAAAFNRAYGLVSPPAFGRGKCVALVNSTIVAVSERREGLPIPLAGVVLVIPEVVLFDIADERVKVSWYAPYEKEKIRNAMAGGPMLVVEGKVMIDKDEEDFSKTAPPVTFSQDETFDTNLLPRMGIGVTADSQFLYAAAVDGRDVDTPGMTLKLLAEFLQALGCSQAMNLDGGSSKRMILGGTVVDNSTTEVKGAGGGGTLDKEKVRVLRTSILFEEKEKEKEAAAAKKQRQP